MGMIGPNGAGKTTVTNLIDGVYKPTGGAIFLNGERIDGLPPYQIARRGIGRTFQVTRAFRRMSVMENMLVPALAIDPAANSTYLQALRKIEQGNEGQAIKLLTGNLEPTARLKLQPVDANRFFPFGAFGSDDEDRYRLPRVALALGPFMLAERDGFLFVNKPVGVACSDDGTDTAALARARRVPLVPARCVLPAAGVERYRVSFEEPLEFDFDDENRLEEAREYYQRLVDEYQESPYTFPARQRLSEIG